MDQIFQDLIGKPNLQPPKIFTIIAENFSFLEDEARFLKATFAIPMVKNLPFDSTSVRLIQIGPLRTDLESLLEKLKWSLSQYETNEGDICDEIESSLNSPGKRCIVFMNDVSRLVLGNNDQNVTRKLLTMVDKLKRTQGHFIIMLYQNAQPNSTSTLIRDMEYISDAVIRVSSCKAGYFSKAWYHSVPAIKTLLPTIVETHYFTSKVGKYYYSPDCLCFYERKNVSSNYDLDTDTNYEADKDEEDLSDQEELLVSRVEQSKINDVALEEDPDSTLPFTRAQNPEQSRIFYYPDKDDDIDEDDPDNDLGI